MSDNKVHFSLEHEGRVARLTLDAPKGNIVDLAMLEELHRHQDLLEETEGLRAIVLDARGPHFSYGASIQEHFPGPMERLLPEFHRWVTRFVDTRAPTIAVVQGTCFGGGLELVAACDLVLASKEARFACPEIDLGVFPPAASALLPVRLGTSAATLFTVTGRPWTAQEAHARNLVHRIAEDDLEDALQEWLKTDFLPRSAWGLEHTVRAARRAIRRAVHEDLPALERQYLQDFMKGEEATEGLTAFLEKRAPRWR